MSVAVGLDGLALAADPLGFLRAHGAGPLAETMGIEFTELGSDRAVATMPVAGNTQSAGLMHGGAYLVLGETLGSVAATLWAGEGRTAVGIEIGATHTHSATSGMVTGVCVPLHLGRSLTVHEVVVSDESGRRCSTIRITNFLKESR
jgi:uncharacterized protein (TIGR00369 family)